MPVTCDTSDAPSLVRYAFAGDWTAEELIVHRKHHVGAGDLTAKTAVLFDLREAASCPNGDDLRAGLHPSASPDVWPICRAFLVRTESQYDCAQQLQTLLGPHAVVNQIFQDEAMAMQWLSALAGRTGALTGHPGSRSADPALKTPPGY